jgi:D-alanyl-D-alanine carboxypeptidase-like protein
MANHLSDPLFLHPILHVALPGIKQAIKDKLKPGWGVSTDPEGIHRTPNEQFDLFKKGRQFINGAWVVVNKSEKVTGKDGFKNPSRHNFLPSTAVDIILIQPDGKVLKSGPEESRIKAGATKFKFEWGGDWTEFQDMPHIQLPLDRLFKSNLVRDEALQWQKYLFHAGELKDSTQLDGAWGDISKAALEKLTATREKTPEAWEALFTKFGPIEDMNDFDGFSWVPKVK